MSLFSREETLIVEQPGANCQFCQSLLEGLQDHKDRVVKLEDLTVRSLRFRVRRRLSSWSSDKVRRSFNLVELSAVTEEIFPVAYVLEARFVLWVVVGMPIVVSRNPFPPAD